MQRSTRKVVRLTESVEAWNVDGSSDACPRRGSWIQAVESATGRRRGKCSFADCPNRAEVGGHVWIRNTGCFIAPICKPCNRCDNLSRMQGSGSRLRRNIEVMETEMTWGMRNAPRRIVVEESEDESDEDESDEDEGCFRCGRTGHWASECYARTYINGGSLR